MKTVVLKVLIDEVIVNLNVLGTLMKDIIMINKNDTAIVNMVTKRKPNRKTFWGFNDNHQMNPSTMIELKYSIKNISLLNS